MNKTTTPQPESSEERPREVALESWKEIAAYLKRDVRTVRRWERDERLPVHRHQHQARSSVYAYPSELETWKAARQPAKEAVDAPWRRAARVAALAAGFLMAVMSVSSGPIRQLEAAGADSASGIVVRQVWAEAMDIEGGVSPDGRYLSFVDWNTGDLAIRDLVTNENRLLTHKGPWTESEEFALFSVISPDNRQVAFTWFNKHVSADLRLVNLDGTNSRVLYENPEVSYPSPLAWSSGTGQILTLLLRMDGTKQIALISATDGSARVLKTLDWRAPGAMAFSPDGRYIAYDFPPREDSPNRDVFILAADGSRETALVHEPSNDTLLGWAPDGKSILFASDRSGKIDAWSVEVAEGRPQGDPQLVKNDIGDVRPLGFTKEGDLFYGVSKGLGGSIHTASVDPATWKLTSSPVRIPQRYVGHNYAPAWSPDGRFLAYLSNRSAGLSASRTVALVIRSTASGDEREIPLNFFYIPNFRWSPDSQSILFSGRDQKGKHEIFKLNTETGEATEIIRSGVGAYGPKHRPELTPDGKTLVFARFEDGLTHTSIVVRDLASGEERSVFSANAPTQIVSWHALSPDGRQIAFELDDQTTRSTTLNVISINGGQPREVLVGHDPEQLGKLLDWTPDGKALVFTRRKSNREELWRIPAGGGQPQLVGDLGRREFFWATLHPAGKQVAIIEGNAGDEVWVMENFLPTQRAAR